MQTSTFPLEAVLTSPWPHRGIVGIIVEVGIAVEVLLVVEITEAGLLEAGLLEA